MQTIKLTMSQHAVERLAERTGIKASTKAPFVLSGYKTISTLGAIHKLVFTHLVFVVDVSANTVLTVYPQ
jgi:hypothetical protein